MEEAGKICSCKVTRRWKAFLRTVNVAQLGETKQIGRLLGVDETVGSRTVDGNSARVGFIRQVAACEKEVW